MIADLAPYEMLRAAKALEASWRRDHAVLDSPELNGISEQPLPQLIARFGAAVIKQTTQDATDEQINTGRPADAFGTHQVAAMVRLSGELMTSWANSTGSHDTAAVAALGRGILQYLVELTQGQDLDDEEQHLKVDLLLTAVRQEALADFK
ncbi:hypothetical protein ACFWA9_32050 [Kitasatospora sp. NPDC059973]|uniref:hypothetical protein n=1 Tax=Kitasatospora sp. NPDC059973 TaxID=3347020 RepID=UPI0036C81E69